MKFSKNVTEEEKEKYLEVADYWEDHFEEIALFSFMHEFWGLLEEKKDIIWIEFPFSIFLPTLQWKLLHFKELWEKYEDWEEVGNKWERFYSLKLEFHPEMSGEGPPLPMSDDFLNDLSDVYYSN